MSLSKQVNLFNSRKKDITGGQVSSQGNNKQYDTGCEGEGSEGQVCIIQQSADEGQEYPIRPGVISAICNKNYPHSASGRKMNDQQAG